MSKLILQEYVEPDISKSKVFLEESEDAFGNKGKSLHMAGVFIQGGVRNANGRIYPVHEIRKAVDFMNSTLAANKGDILGHLDHPSDLQIALDRVSHKIVSMEMEGANGIGKLKILPTPLGNIAKVMLESGVRLGVSSRGSGNVDEGSGHVSEFEIVTVDIVAQPSAPNAYPKAIYEGLFGMRHGHKLYDLSAEASYANKHNIPVDPRINKYLREGILNLIKDMKLK